MEDREKNHGLLPVGRSAQLQSDHLCMLYSTYVLYYVHLNIQMESDSMKMEIEEEEK